MAWVGRVNPSAIRVVPIAAACILGLTAATFPADEVHWTITGQNSVTVDWRGGDAEVRYGTTQALERRVEAVARTGE